MLKRAALLIGAGVLVGAMGVQTSASDGTGRHRRQYRAGAALQWSQANISHLYLFEKDPVTWQIVEEGAWGVVHYTSSGPEFRFVFRGHGMAPDAEYTLIYYPDPWPGYGLMCLASGTADERGEVYIRGSVETGDLPAEHDANLDTGAKIWLVRSSDVSCDTQQMEAWNPVEYLFENELIFFVTATEWGRPYRPGPRDQTRIALGLYERLEGDADDMRGSGELYGCVNVEAESQDLLSVRTKLRYAVPDTMFDVYMKLGEDHAAAQDNPLYMGEIHTDGTGQAVARWDVDVSPFTAVELYVQAVVVPTEVSATLGYASDARPVLLVGDGGEGAD